MITQTQYLEYLLSTPINYTCANLAEHLGNISYDAITDFLQNSEFAPQDLWAVVKERLTDSPKAYLLVEIQCKTNAIRRLLRRFRQRRALYP